MIYITYVYKPKKYPYRLITGNLLLNDFLTLTRPFLFSILNLNLFPHSTPLLVYFLSNFNTILSSNTILSIKQTGFIKQCCS